jgi:hypothetical protein
MIQTEGAAETMAIWIPEFEAYLQNRLSTITLPDENGAQVPISASYRMSGTKTGSADADSKRPGIIYHNYDGLHDVSRETSAVMLKASWTATDVDIKDAPIPWNLYYEFNLLADFRIDLIPMEVQFLKLFPPRGAIQVIDPEDNSLNAYDFFLVQVLPGDSYLALNNGGAVQKRIFRKTYRYVIRTETDFATAQTFKRVLDIQISGDQI